MEKKQKLNIMKTEDMLNDEFSVLTIYLQEIDRYPLLDPKQEAEIAKQMVEGEAAKREEARKKLIQSNLRYVVNIAKRYSKEDKGRQFLDFIQEGNLGLIKATERFDYTKGFRFSTYASYDIRQRILASLAQNGRVATMKPWLSSKVNRVIKMTDYLQNSLGREPTVAELSRKLEMPPKEVEYFQKANQDTLGSEEIFNEDGESLYPDRSVDDPAKNACDAVFRQQMIQEINKLPARERTVIRLRYGIDDGKQRTLKEVAKDCGLQVSHERIRQIEEKAFRRFRNPKYEKKFKDFLEK